MDEDAARRIKPAVPKPVKKRKPIKVLCPSKANKLKRGNEELKKAKVWKEDFEDEFSPSERAAANMAFKNLVVRCQYKDEDQVVKNTLRKRICQVLHNWINNGKRITEDNYTDGLIALIRSCKKNPGTKPKTGPLNTPAVLKRILRMRMKLDRSKEFHNTLVEGSFEEKFNNFKECHRMSLEDFESHLDEFRKVFRKEHGQLDNDEMFRIQLREKISRENGMSQQDRYATPCPSPEETSNWTDERPSSSHASYDYRSQNYQSPTEEVFRDSLASTTSNFVYTQHQAGVVNSYGSTFNYPQSQYQTYNTGMYSPYMVHNPGPSTYAQQYSTFPNF